MSLQVRARAIATPSLDMSGVSHSSPLPVRGARSPQRMSPHPTAMHPSAQEVLHESPSQSMQSGPRLGLGEMGMEHSPIPSPSPSLGHGSGPFRTQSVMSELLYMLEPSESTEGPLLVAHASSQPELCRPLAGEQQQQQLPGSGPGLGSPQEAVPNNNNNAFLPKKKLGLKAKIEGAWGHHPALPPPPTFTAADLAASGKRPGEGAGPDEGAAVGGSAAPHSPTRPGHRPQGSQGSMCSSDSQQSSRPGSHSTAHAGHGGSGRQAAGGPAAGWGSSPAPPTASGPRPPAPRAPSCPTAARHNSSGTAGPAAGGPGTGVPEGRGRRASADTGAGAGGAPACAQIVFGAGSMLYTGFDADGEHKPSLGQQEVLCKHPVHHEALHATFRVTPGQGREEGGAAHHGAGRHRHGAQANSQHLQFMRDEEGAGQARAQPPRVITPEPPSHRPGGNRRGFTGAPASGTLLKLMPIRQSTPLQPHRRHGTGATLAPHAPSPHVPPQGSVFQRMTAPAHDVHVATCSSPQPMHPDPAAAPSPSAMYQASSYPACGLEHGGCSGSYGSSGHMGSVGSSGHLGGSGPASSSPHAEREAPSSPTKVAHEAITPLTLTLSPEASLATLPHQPASPGGPRGAVPQRVFRSGQSQALRPSTSAAVGSGTLGGPAISAAPAYAATHVSLMRIGLMRASHDGASPAAASGATAGLSGSFTSSVSSCSSGMGMVEAAAATGDGLLAQAHSVGSGGREEVTASSRLGMRGGSHDVVHPPAGGSMHLSVAPMVVASRVSSSGRAAFPH